MEDIIKITTEKGDKPEIAIDVQEPNDQLPEVQEFRTMKDSITFFESVFIEAGATATDYGVFFISPCDCVVLSAQESHAVLGTDGSAVTLTVEKLTSGQASGAGVNVLTSTFNLKATINTPVELLGSTTTANIQLRKGDRLNLLTTGTLTSVRGVSVTVVLKTPIANLPE